MKSKQKILIDVMMTILFMIQMAYHITGNRLHEWLGVFLFALFILHHVFNRNWYKNLLKGKYTLPRIVMITINTLLFVSMIGMMVSGIMLSRDVFSFLNLRSGMFARRIHMVSTSWGYLLMSMHIGLHWGLVSGRMKKIAFLSMFSTVIVNMVKIAVCGYGLVCLITNQLLERMFLLVEYAFFDYSQPVLFFFSDYLCIMICFAMTMDVFIQHLRKEG